MLIKYKIFTSFLFMLEWHKAKLISRIAFYSAADSPGAGKRNGAVLMKMQLY